MIEYRKKLIEELGLHNAYIYAMQLINNKFNFKVSCDGMDVTNYFKDIDNIIITFECSNIYKLNFDFEDSILIDNLKISKKNEKYIIKTEDLEVECTNLNLRYKVTKIKDKNNKLLDDYLKSSK